MTTRVRRGTWNEGIELGLPSPNRRPRSATAYTNFAMHPSRPDTVFMQKHWDICRTDDAGESWTEVSGNVPSDFGFPIVVHAHEPETIFVVAYPQRHGALSAGGKAARISKPLGGRRVGGAHQRPPATQLLRERPA